jgi:hypothetical protein
MKLANAIKKLEKAGYDITGKTGFYIATFKSITISFSAHAGTCSKFTFDSESSCAPTYGLNLTQAMA